MQVQYRDTKGGFGQPRYLVHKTNQRQLFKRKKMIHITFTTLSQNEHSHYYYPYFQTHADPLLPYADLDLDFDAVEEM